jgi:Holliday junction resolvasome RuvABC endonuclease subunit
MRIFCIDPSLRSSGICAAEINIPTSEEIVLFFRMQFDRNILSSILTPAFTICFKEEISLPKALLKKEKELREKKKALGDIFSWSDEVLMMEKLDYQISTIISSMERFRPDVILIEEYAYAAAGSATQLAEVRGYLKSRIMQSDFKLIPYVQIPIGSIKKIATGSGNSPKDVVYRCLKEEYGFAVEQKNDDENDALAIALAGMYGVFTNVQDFQLDPELRGKKKEEQNRWSDCFQTLKRKMNEAYVYTTTRSQR